MFQKPYIIKEPTSEPLYICLQQQGIRPVLNWHNMPLTSHLCNAVDPWKQYGVVYKILCECGKQYITLKAKWEDAWLYEQIMAFKNSNLSHFLVYQ